MTLKKKSLKFVFVVFLPKTTSKTSKSKGTHNMKKTGQKTGQTTGWLAAFFLAAGITKASEINYGNHRNLILQTAREANPNGMKILDDLIDKTAKEPPQIGIFKFQHIDGDPQCLCALCREEGANVLLELYKRLGIVILPAEGEITIVFRTTTTTR